MLTDYSDVTPDVTILFDKLGRQQSVTTTLAKSEFTYQPATLALLTETIRYNLDATPGYEFTRTLDRSRDSLGRDTGYSLKTENSTLETSAAYAYSPTDGRLAQISNPLIPNQLFTYSYLANSNLLASVTGPVHTVTNTYEPTRDLLTTRQNKAGTAVISQYDYSVNVIGQRSAVSQTGTAFSSARSIAWGYDPLGQVITADSSINTADRAYQYDTIGNRQKSANSLTLPVANNYAANSLNQYTSFPSVASVPSYDPDGNLTSGPLPNAPTANSTLVWDAENRLISTTVGTITTTYQYDALSRRIAKTTGTNKSVFLYNGWNCIADYSLSSNQFTLQKTRLWGQDLSGSMQGAGGVGGLLSESNISNPQSPISYPLYDGNGNVTEYLTATGSVAAHYEYDPFGNTVVNTDTANLFNYKFSTKPVDQETGLYYYGFRYYDPMTGRWPSRDPIEEKGGLSLYGMVYNSPIELIDILGFSTWWDIVSTLPFFGTLYNIIASPAGSHVGDYTINISEELCELDPEEAIRKCKDKIAIQEGNYIAKYASLNIAHEVLDGFGSLTAIAPAFWIDGAIDFFVSLYKIIRISDAADMAKLKCVCQSCTQR